MNGRYPNISGSRLIQTTVGSTPAILRTGVINSTDRYQYAHLSSWVRVVKRTSILGAASTAVLKVLYTTTGNSPVRVEVLAYDEPATAEWTRLEADLCLFSAGILSFEYTVKTNRPDSETYTVYLDEVRTTFSESGKCI